MKNETSIAGEKDIVHAVIENKACQLEVIGQNLRHANLSVTDGVYRILSETDVSSEIFRLGQISKYDNDEATEVIPLLEKILIELRSPQKTIMFFTIYLLKVPQQFDQSKNSCHF